MASSRWLSSEFALSKSSSDNTQNDHPFRKRARKNEDTVLKKKRAVHAMLQPKTSLIDDVMWTEKYSPQTKDDLAVHKKKVLEVEEWLIDSLKTADKNKGASLLLLTGPPGVGKTATIHALSKDLNLELKEWINSTQNSLRSAWNPNEYSSMGSIPDFAYENQASVFRNFLLRANKYPPLFSSCTGQIVLIEEFPNIFFKETAAFHEILRKFHRSGRCPLIFIVSDCTAGESAEHSLFPKDLQNELCIKNISFNPVAPTMLLKTLNRINMDVKGSSEKKLSKTELDAIVSECAGDIRSAINTMQFLSVPRNVKTAIPLDKVFSVKEKKLQLTKPADENSIGNRDSSLFLFHALGKILYCKRDKTKNAEEYPLPAHLRHFSRAPLLANPEEVYGKTSISEEGFILFLQQNYLSFVQDIKVAAECSSWLSDSENLTVEWSERHAMNTYAASLATRGLMFNLTPSSSGNKWRPFHKPQYFNSTKDNRYLSQSVRHAFRGKQLSLRELQVDLIPYVAKISASSLNNEMRQLVNQVAFMQLKGVHRFHSDSLCEKELCEINLNDLESYHEVIKKSSMPDDGQAKIFVPDTLEEEFVIEECDI